MSQTNEIPFVERSAALCPAVMCNLSSVVLCVLLAIRDPSQDSNCFSLSVKDLSATFLRKEEGSQYVALAVQTAAIHHPEKLPNAGRRE